MTDAPDPKRRRTLVVLASATGCAALGLVAPTFAFVAQAEEASAEGAGFRPLEIGLEELEFGKPRRARLDGDVKTVVWLVRSGAELRAFAARCPHLGCSVGISEDQQSFECPCHHARFALDGVRLERAHNPAPRDMDPLEVRVDGATSRIEVRAVRYQPGIPERVVIGSSEG